MHLFFRVFSAASFAPCALSENKFSKGKDKGLLSVRYLPLASPPKKEEEEKHNYYYRYDVLCVREYVRFRDCFAPCPERRKRDREDIYIPPHTPHTPPLPPSVSAAAKEGRRQENIFGGGDLVMMLPPPSL